MQNLLGLLLPPFIDLINRRVKDADARFWISVLVCSIIGVLSTVVFTNFFAGLTVSEAFEVTAVTIISTFGLAQLSYGAVWKRSGTRKKMDLDATVRPTLK